MTRYKYIAVAPGKKPSEIIIEADSEREALSKLRSGNWIPLRFCGDADAQKKSIFAPKSKVDVYEFTRQLAPLLKANIQLERALAIIAESASEKDQKDFVQSLRQGLHEGKKFSDLVRSYGNLFPNYYANLLESGEESGCLPQVMQELYKFMGDSKELKDFIVSSSIYPLAILGVVIGVTVLLFTVFVPRFAKIFTDMGRALPGAMKILVSVGDFFAWGWWGIPLALFLSYILVKKYLGEQEWKRRLGAFTLKLPLFGQIIINLEMCKYLQTLTILITNHVEIIKTVGISGRIIANPVIFSAFKDLDKKLKSGEKLSSALSDNHFVPPGTVAMLRVGEESGNVGEMLGNIAGNLEADTKLRIKRLLSLFEPVIIIFLAVVVLAVVIAIFMAMMEINAISKGGQ